MTAAERDQLGAGLLAEEGLLRPGELVRLRASNCPACARWEFPALTYCPGCDGRPESSALSEQATVIGVTAVLHPPPGALVEVPYTVALAAFPEGVAVLGVVTAALGDVPLGQRVETVAMLIGERVGYGFQLAEGAG
jgi:uncharacterized OB-fold protein